MPLAVFDNFPQLLLSVVLPNSVVYCKNISSKSKASRTCFSINSSEQECFFQGVFLSVLFLKRGLPDVQTIARCRIYEVTAEAEEAAKGGSRQTLKTSG